MSILMCELQLAEYMRLPTIMQKYLICIEYLPKRPKISFRKSIFLGIAIFLRVSLGGTKKTFYFCNAFEKNGRIAQLVQSICLTSRGSAVRIRLRPQPFSILLIRILIGRIAQLVQSICLTSRGSAVRIRLRPHRFRYITPKVIQGA